MNENVYNIGEGRRYHHPAPERSLSETLNEASREFRQFIETRIAMFRAEMREKIGNVKFAAPLVIVGGLFAVSAWMVLTGALVAVIAVAFRGTLYGPFIALIIVGVFYAIVAACALWMAYGRLRERGIVPQRTINVLREDKVWLQNEARNQL